MTRHLHLNYTNCTLQTWNQYFTMSGNDARYLTYTFGPNCKLEKVTCGPAYYAECGITSTYRSCTQRFCLRAAQSYLGACTIKVELNPDAACTNTNNGMLWNHQVRAVLKSGSSEHLLVIRLGDLFTAGLQ